MELGRWGNERTARIYVDQAMAQQIEGSLSQGSLEILQAGVRVAKSLLDKPEKAIEQLRELRV